MNYLERLILNFSFGQSVRITFYSLMRDFVKDGIPVYEALKEIAAASVTDKIDFFPKRVIHSLMMSFRGKSGAGPATLGLALQGLVDPIESALIDAGERSGKLEVGLAEVVSLMESKSRIKGTVIGAMIYPIMLLFMLCGFLWVVSSQIIPVMADVLPRSKWPPMAQIVGVISDNAGLILLVIFGFVGLVVVSFVLTAERWVGPARDSFDRYIMPWSSYKMIQSSMTLVSLSMMIESGLPVGSAINLLNSISTPWLRHHFNIMLLLMRKGKAEGIAITGGEGVVGLFDALTSWEIRMYGARSSFATRLKNLSSRSVNRLENSLKFQFMILRNILLVVVAGMLGGTFSSFMSITMQLGKH